MKKSKKQKNNINTPWYKEYKDVPSHLEYPNSTMIDYLEECSKDRLHKLAFKYYGKSYTFKSMLENIDNIARSLKALGIAEDDKVTICMPNTPEGVMTFYAVNKIGAVANMIHPLSSEKEIEFYVNNVESKFILTVDVACQKILNIVENTSLEKVVVASASASMNPVMSGLYYVTEGRKIKYKKADKNLLIEWKDFISLGSHYLGRYKTTKGADDLAIILYSGGTTGTPKGIGLSNRNFNALAMQAHLMCDPAKEGDSILSIMPIFHGFGLGVCIHTTLCIGMTCILIPAFQAKKFGDLIKKYKPNFIVGVPTLFEAMLNSKKIKKNDLSCVTCMVSGGDFLTVKLKNEIDKFLHEHGSKAEVRPGYGLTESSAATCLSPTGRYREGTIGIPFPDTYFKIVKIGTHDEAEYNTDGEICITGPTVMMGYVNNEKETIQTLRVHDDGILWLHTGDIGSMDEDGYIYFKQRLKRMIVSSGYNIYPSQIEKIISEHEDVLTCTVIGIDHPYKVQVAKAYIVLKDGIEPTKEVKESIKEYCERNIAKYALPYEYEYRSSLPTTLVGKVAYRELEKENKK
mgnify:CR=1 FL=1